MARQQGKAQHSSKASSLSNQCSCQDTTEGGGSKARLSLWQRLAVSVTKLRSKKTLKTKRGDAHASLDLQAPSDLMQGMIVLSFHCKKSRLAILQQNSLIDMNARETSSGWIWMRQTQRPTCRAFQAAGSVAGTQAIALNSTHVRPCGA